MTTYVIYDERGEGWIAFLPMAGWCFAALSTSAFEFPSIEEAQAVMRQHFGTCRGQLVIHERLKEEQAPTH